MLMWYFVRYLLSNSFKRRQGVSQEAQVTHPFWVRFSHTTILQFVQDFGLLSFGALQPKHFPLGRMYP